MLNLLGSVFRGNVISRSNNVARYGRSRTKGNRQGSGSGGKSGRDHLVPE